MNSSRVRLTVVGTACGALALFPAFSSTQSPAENGAGRNLTRQAQTEVSIALPSFAPLAERVLPPEGVDVGDPVGDAHLSVFADDRHHVLAPYVRVPVDRERS